MIKTYLPQSELYVAFNKNVPVAFSASCQNILAALFVHPMHWRKGIGKKLLSILFLMHKQLELSVYQDNRNAILFYQRSGFIKTTERACQHTGKIEDIMQWHAWFTFQRPLFAKHASQNLSLCLVTALHPGTTRTLAVRFSPRHSGVGLVWTSLS